MSWSWTENWPYEPEVGNTPTTNTFVWTWASFCFTFLAFGARAVHLRVLAQRPGRRTDGPGAGEFRPLTAEPAQGRQILPRGRGGAAAADPRRHDHGARLLRPAQLLRHRTCTTSCRSTSCATCTSRRRSSGSACRGSAPGLFLAPAIAGGREARGQGLLVDLLFWVTLLIVAGALIGDWLGIMGYIDRRLVLVRQSGAVLHPARPRLADRLLRSAC